MPVGGCLQATTPRRVIPVGCPRHRQHGLPHARPVPAALARRPGVARLQQRCYLTALPEYHLQHLRHFGIQYTE